MLDEPFRAMDTVTKSASHQYLLELYDATGKTIFFITHDLEEAIFPGRQGAGDDHPARLHQKDLAGKPAPPRQYSMLASEEFLAMKAQLVEAVHEEAVKAFEAGEREMA